KNHEPHDGQHDGNYLTREIPRQPLEFEKNEPGEECVDAKQDDFHYAFPLICASSSATRARSCSSSLVADFSPAGFSCESSTSVPYSILCKSGIEYAQSQAIGQSSPQKTNDSRHRHLIAQSCGC